MKLNIVRHITEYFVYLFFFFLMTYLVFKNSKSVTLSLLYDQPYVNIQLIIWALL